MPIEYITRTAIVTAIGKTRTDFGPGKPVMVKSFINRVARDVPGVNIGVKFDFDPNNWYSGNFTQEDVNKYIAEGKQVDIKTWSKEVNGTVYNNFAIAYAKKPDVTEVMKKTNELIPTVERHDKQIMSLYADVQAIKAWIDRHDTTTMFDADAPVVHPAEARALNGGQLPPIQNPMSTTAMTNEDLWHSQEQPPLEAYNNDGDINPEDIPF